MSLIDQYRVLHDKGWFAGLSLRPHVEDIAKLVKDTGSTSLLDYGCGKAQAWEEGARATVGLDPTLYDPAVRGFTTKPQGQFDGVICTDVLEHLENPEEVIAELIGYARKFLFLSICCRASEPHKKLPDGRPVHICVQPPEWWRARINAPHLRVELRFDEAS